MVAMSSLLRYSLRQKQHEQGVDSGSEKLPLIHEQELPPQPPPRRPLWTSVLLVLLILGVLRSAAFYLIFSGWGFHTPTRMGSLEKCTQVDPLHPTHGSPALSKMEDFILSPAFRNDSIARMSGAVQIPTESYDDLGPIDEDVRFKVFFDFAAYLEQQFPLIHSTLQLEKVNTHGLLYTWKGTDKSLKPTVLMAHQDVVPVAKDTRSQWTHDAYSGYYDGKYIWGRGASDCKNHLIGAMEAVEQLINAGFEPKRTLILSFGFDEETGVGRGAGYLAEHLVARYEKTGGAAVIFDEGAGVINTWGANFAALGVAEKGYIDVEIIVRMPGGHSSIPPSHTGIGVASELIGAIEAQQYEPRLYPQNPFLSLMQCGAAHGPDFPRKLRKLLSKHRHQKPCKKDKLAEEASNLGPAVKYLFTTSQAVDIINGGVKSNALPERTRVLINHRVNVGESTDVVKTKVSRIAAHIACKYNLTLHAFSNDTETPSSITLTSVNSIEPAPVTPTSIDSATPYSVVSGTLRALYGDKLLVAPALMTGNTDTKFYWDLSKHIFRYDPGWDPDSVDPMKFIHTVNERISVVNHIRTIQWLSLFIRNMDEADLE